MAGLDDLLQQIPYDSLAGQLGVDPGTARQLTEQALPALMAGMGANAGDPAGAASLASAVQQHSPDLVTGGIDLSQVDVADGEKIVGHVFGEKTPQVVSALGSQGGGGGDLMRRLLPLLAPLVMSFLSQQMAGRSADAGTAAGAGPAGSGTTGSGLEDLLGGLLGGTGGTGGGGGAGSILDMLGGLLGGGKR
jgi:hypothetical protein